MRALLQRVSDAEVKVDGESVGACGPGLLILICAMAGDTVDQGKKLAQKIAKLRIFQDEAGKMNLSLRDISGEALIVSQFTLGADTKGTRPGFSKAAKPDVAKELYEEFITALKAESIPCQTGIFGADMKVSLTNDGPVTIWLDTENRA